MSWQLEHEKYLKSATWGKKREEVFAHYGRKCASCGSTDHLSVHHISYITYNKKGKGKELMRELIPLCRHHHHLVHALIKEFLEHEKRNYKYNWDKASKEAINYLVSPKRKAKIRKRNKKKQKELDKLNRGIGCAKGSHLKYIPNDL